MTTVTTARALRRRHGDHAVWWGEWWHQTKEEVGLADGRSSYEVNDLAIIYLWQVFVLVFFRRLPPCHHTVEAGCQRWADWSELGILPLNFLFHLRKRFVPESNGGCFESSHEWERRHVVRWADNERLTWITVFAAIVCLRIVCVHCHLMCVYTPPINPS